MLRRQSRPREANRKGYGDPRAVERPAIRLALVLSEGQNRPRREKEVPSGGRGARIVPSDNERAQPSAETLADYGLSKDQSSRFQKPGPFSKEPWSIARE
jgi:hypothetical protein